MPPPDSKVEPWAGREYVTTCQWCRGREDLTCPRCKGSRYERRVTVADSSLSEFVRPATREEYDEHVRARDEERWGLYRG